jgi:release factor glutamine methyltransferase
MLFRYLAKEHLNKKKFLELGAGSGLLSIYAAKRGASVVATDINPIAVRCIEANVAENSVSVATVYSNLFDALPRQVFDFIAINPPYYKKSPSSVSDYAWYCGERGEYFQNLFTGLSRYMDNDSSVLMVLCDGCDLQMIKNYAMENSFSMKCVQSRKTLIERNFIFKIFSVK